MATQLLQPSPHNLRLIVSTTFSYYSSLASVISLLETLTLSHTFRSFSSVYQGILLISKFSNLSILMIINNDLTLNAQQCGSL